MAQHFLPDTKRSVTMLVLLVVLAATSCTVIVQAQPAPSSSPSSTPTTALNLNPENCAANSGCNDCVSAGCAWGIGTCFDSCDSLTELPCYSLAGGSSSGTSSSSTISTAVATAICNRQRQESADAANCGIQTDCESCTAQSLTSVNPFAPDFEDGTPTTCSWYESQQKCASTVCDSSGDCASPYCPSSPEGQCYFGADNCLDCLQVQVTSKDSTPDSCSWSGGNCELNCIEDATCYSPAVTEFEDLSNEEICTIANSAEEDTALCAAQSDNGCEACIATTKSDGENCQYYYDAVTQTRLCGVGGCLETGLCGRDDCEGVPDDTTELVCDALADERDVTCVQCLEAECAWSVGETCLPSCDVIADASCWDSDSGTAFSTPTSICNDAEEAIVDEETCSGIDECDVCTSTFKSDRRSTCEWYVDEVSDTTYCGTGGCDANGVCGTVICDGASDRGSCSTSNTCSTCLEDDECFWVDESCQSSCAAFPGETCSSTTTSPGSTISEICNTAEGNQGGGEVDVDSSAKSFTVGRISMLVVVCAFIVL